MKPTQKAQKRLGDIATKEELGILHDMFEGDVRLLKITYSYQDKNGTNMDLALKHKDYVEQEDDNETQENEDE